MTVINDCSFHSSGRTVSPNILADSIKEQVPSSKGPGKSRTSIWRAERAKRLGRDPHKDGCPGYLNRTERKEALTWLTTQIQNGINPTVSSFIHEVKTIRNKRDTLEPKPAIDGPSRKWVKRFIKLHPLFRRTLVKILDVAKIRACIRPLFQEHFKTLDQLMETNKYTSKYILNLDETSFLVKTQHREMVISSAAKELVFKPQSPPLFTATCVFITTALGDWCRPRIILPPSRSASHFRASLSQHVDYHESASGWMTKALFEEIMIHPERGLVQEIHLMRQKDGETKERVLLLVDGHTSRGNPPLMSFLYASGIDVYVFPAHTSHRLQPNDYFVNAAWKRRLQEVQHCPSIKVWPTQGAEFLHEIETVAFSALQRNVIKSSWAAAGFNPDLRKMLISTTPERCPPQFQRAPSTRFSLGGKVISDPIFLKHWKTISRQKSFLSNFQQSNCFSQSLGASPSTSLISSSTSTSSSVSSCIDSASHSPMIKHLELEEQFAKCPDGIDEQGCEINDEEENAVVLYTASSSESSVPSLPIHPDFGRKLKIRLLFDDIVPEYPSGETFPNDSIFPLQQ